MAILPFLLLLPKPTSFSLNTPHHRAIKTAMENYFHSLSLLSLILLLIRCSIFILLSDVGHIGKAWFISFPSVVFTLSTPISFSIFSDPLTYKVFSGSIQWVVSSHLTNTNHTSEINIIWSLKALDIWVTSLICCSTFNFVYIVKFLLRLDNLTIIY